MKTPPYTKWFSYQPGEEAMREARSAAPARLGSVLAHKEIHINDCPSNGESETLEDSCTVPYAETEPGKPVPELTKASISLLVEDWGKGTITNAQGESEYIDCEEKPGLAGDLGGHGAWGGAISLACGPGNYP